MNPNILQAANEYAGIKDRTDHDTQYYNTAGCDRFDAFMKGVVCHDYLSKPLIQQMLSSLEVAYSLLLTEAKKNGYASYWENEIDTAVNMRKAIKDAKDHLFI